MKFQISRRLRDSDGKGMIGCMALIVLTLTALFLTAKLAPIYYSKNALESDIQAEAGRAGAGSLDDEAITKFILESAQKNELPIEKNNIQVRRFAGQISIEVDYNVPVDFGIMSHNLNFQTKASSLIVNR
jgi:hypothetical protein